MIVGIMGKAQAGKDTLGGFLVENHGFTRVAFADAVKDVLLEVDPQLDVWQEWGGVEGTWDLSVLVEADGWDLWKQHPDVRGMLQRLGTAVRDLDPAFWIKGVDRRIKELGPDADVVITDVRFANEAWWISGRGGLLVRVVRPALDYTDRHVSENELNDFAADLTVVNDDGLDVLERAAEMIHTNLRKKTAHYRWQWKKEEL